MAQTGTPAEQLERLRRLAESEGIPIDCVERLAIAPARAARCLDVSRRTIDRLIASGVLPATEVSGRRRVNVVDLMGYLHEQRDAGERGGEDEALRVVEDFRRG